MPPSAFAVNGAAALGAGDDDLALAAGHAAHGAAVGAGEIFVFLVHAAHPAVSGAAAEGVIDLR